MATISEVPPNPPPSVPSAPMKSRGFLAGDGPTDRRGSAPPLDDEEIETPFGVFSNESSKKRAPPERGYSVAMMTEASTAKDHVLTLVQELVEEKQVVDEGQQELRRRDVVSSFASYNPLPGSSMTSLPPIDVVKDSTVCFMFTTGSSGKKEWVSSNVEVVNHSIIMSDNEGGGQSKKGQRVYSMSKSGEAKLDQNYEGRSNVLLIKCVEGSKSKYLSFDEVTEMNRFEKILSHFFNTSAAEMAEVRHGVTPILIVNTPLNPSLTSSRTAASNPEAPQLPINSP